MDKYTRKLARRTKHKRLALVVATILVTLFLAYITLFFVSVVMGAFTDAFLLTDGERMANRVCRQNPAAYGCGLFDWLFPLNVCGLVSALTVLTGGFVLAKRFNKEPQQGWDEEFSESEMFDID